MEILQFDSPAAGAVKAGDLVCVREALWRVMDVRAFARTRIVRLVGADDRNRWQPGTFIEPFDRPSPVTVRQLPAIVSRRRWMRTLAALAASAPPGRCPASIADAEVTLMPHQLEPLIAILRGDASRLLLADEVGLGKTIQAALLIRELRARGRADRVLILVPPGLREQWQQELQQRAGLSSRIVDAASLAARTRELPPDRSPWQEPDVQIASIDFIRQPHVLHGAETVAWDILVADEAHGLSIGTDRAAAVHALARHSRHVLLLTATPHHGSDEAFAALCRVGQLDADPLAIVRHTRGTVGRSRPRRVHVLRVTPTPQERWMQTLLVRYARRVERERPAVANAILAPRERACDARAGSAPDSGTDVPWAATCALREAETHGTDSRGRTERFGRTDAALALAVLVKRASSSAWSFARSVQRRLDLLVPGESDDRPLQTWLPFSSRRGDDTREAGDEAGADASEEDMADREPDAALGVPGLKSARVERAWLKLLLAAARNAARAESKPMALKRWLRRTREPVLVYTEYRDTLNRLTAAIPADVPYAVLHGGLGAGARREALRRFLSGDARVLLTTDAAGEGLNLHHRCRLVLNVELPWNPNRLEQRIGRVDRLGQSRTVHAVHLVAADSAEDLMLERLATRLGRIAEALGNAPAILRRAPDAWAHPSAAVQRCVAGPDAAPERAGVDIAASAETAPAETGLSPDIVRPDHTLEARAVAGQLQFLRSAHAAARPRDLLLSLERRAPLVTVVRPAVRARHRLAAGGAGLLCVWRTRLREDDGRARQPVITPVFIRMTVPRCASRRALAAFVRKALQDAGGRLGPLLDREVQAARGRIDDEERGWRERLACRDAAIARELRMGRGGPVQPLLFDEVALDRRLRTRADGSTRRGDAPAEASAARDGAAWATAGRERAHGGVTSAPQPVASERTDSSSSDHALALVAVIR